MIPKKLIIFFALVLGGIAYLLKGRSLNELQSGEIRQKAMKEKMVVAEKEAEKERIEKGYQYEAGTCLTNDKDGWEFTKILAIGDKTYRLIDCHKYKGCTEQKDVSWTDIDYEFRHGRKIKCTR